MFESYHQQEAGLLPEFEQLFPETSWLQGETGATTIIPGLQKIKHFTIAKKLNVSGKLVAAGTEEMSPANMNPGYLDASGNGVVHAKLQQLLGNLITSKYKKYIQGSTASKADKIFIALVDLSGDKINKPQFADWGATFAKYPASTGKITALYGMMQLRFDLQKHLADAGVTNKADVPKFLGGFQKANKLPGYELNWSKLFDYENTGSGAIVVKLSAALDKMIVDTFKNNNNYAASQLIKNVSYPYLASALLQSGITSEMHGGLWVTSGYGGTAAWGGRPPVKFNLGGSISATALSCANFFTLMAQGRLVGDSSSQTISRYLHDACSFFWTSNARSVISVAGDVPTKCGIWSKYKSDVILVNYSSGAHRYVACVLSELAHDANFKPDEMLIDFDALIRANKP